MKKIFLFMFMQTFLFAQEPIQPTIDNDINVVVKNDDSEYKNLQWNRYTTDNFTILSISDKQGRWLYNNIEDIKNWSLKRWGISEYKLKKECRIMVVPNKDLFKRFFNLDENHVEFREKDGVLDIIAIWLCLEDNNKDQVVDDIPRILTSVCVRDFALDSNKKFIEVGMSLLNQSDLKIKETLNNTNDFNIDFLKIKNSDYNKLSEEEKLNYNKQSMLFCLFLKKEFGEFNFLKMLFSKGEPISNIRDVYHFDENELKLTTKRYFNDIKNVLKNDTIDNKYLKVEKGRVN